MKIAYKALFLPYALGALSNKRELQFFLQKRTADDPNRHLRGKWALFGGSLEQGESMEMAVIREVKEELDLEISPQKLEQFHFSPWRTVFLYPVNDPENFVKKITVLEGENGKFWSALHLPDNLTLLDRLLLFLLRRRCL